jgi:hypothetical protein
MIITQNNEPMDEIFQSVDPCKMKVFKNWMLYFHLSRFEYPRMTDCTYLLTIENDKITMLETWYNPRGDHGYKENFRREFELDIFDVYLKDLFHSSNRFEESELTNEVLRREELWSQMKNFHEIKCYVRSKRPKKIKRIDGQNPLLASYNV